MNNRERDEEQDKRGDRKTGGERARRKRGGDMGIKGARQQCFFVHVTFVQIP